MKGEGLTEAGCVRVGDLMEDEGWKELSEA